MPVFDVRCDMETDGGGWIVFQRRVDGLVSFYRNWNQYKAGFGDMNGNFWLGLAKIHKLAGPGKRAILRVDLKSHFVSGLKYAEYNKFEISDETDGYKLTISGYSGDAGDSLSHHNGMKFSTYDRDNDVSQHDHCAAKRGGAWWYRSCYRSHLNGNFVSKYVQDSYYHMSWEDLAGHCGDITFSEMKIRYPKI